MEQPASQASSKIFSKTDEQRYQQLTALYIDGKADAAQEAEFQELRKKKISARIKREQCIAQLIKDIKEQDISFAELTKAGLRVPPITDLYSESEIRTAAKALGVTPTAKPVEVTQPKMSGKKREVKGYIKSIRNPDETGVWRAGPPSFFKEEGGLDKYEQGKLIDQWLVDTKDVSSKIKLLKNLEKKFGKEPSQEQLGDITAEAYAQG